MMRAAPPQMDARDWPLVGPTFIDWTVDCWLDLCPDVVESSDGR